MRRAGGRDRNGVGCSGDRRVTSIRRGDTAATHRYQGGAQSSRAAAQSRVRRQGYTNSAVSAGEMNCPAVPGRRVVELIQRRDRKIERRPRRRARRCRHREVSRRRRRRRDAVRRPRDTRACRVRSRNRLAARRFQRGAECSRAAAERRIREKRRRPVRAREMHRPVIPGHRVVERIQRRHREIERRPGSRTSRRRHREVTRRCRRHRDAVRRPGNTRGCRVCGRNRLTPAVCSVAPNVPVPLLSAIFAGSVADAFELFPA